MIPLTRQPFSWNRESRGARLECCLSSATRASSATIRYTSEPDRARSSPMTELASTIASTRDAGSSGVPAIMLSMSAIMRRKSTSAPPTGPTTSSGSCTGTKAIRSSGRSVVNSPKRDSNRYPLSSEARIASLSAITTAICRAPTLSASDTPTFTKKKAATAATVRKTPSLVILHLHLRINLYNAQSDGQSGVGSLFVQKLRKFQFCLRIRLEGRAGRRAAL